jgi:predicted outer membrane lipoprotein
MHLVDAEAMAVELVEVHAHKSRQCLLLFLRLTPSTSLILGISLSCHFRQQLAIYFDLLQNVHNDYLTAESQMIKSYY